MKAAKFGHDFPAHLNVNTIGGVPAPRNAHKMVFINSPEPQAGQFDGGKLSVLKLVKFIFQIICWDRLGQEVPASDNLRASSPGLKKSEKRVL
jgi:hypothetical protein